MPTSVHEKVTAVDKTVADLQAKMVGLLDGINSIGKMTHASVAISGAAILDSTLERCLKRTMRKMTKKMYDDLFEPMRSLGSFAPKIALAYALEVIDLDTYNELQKIRKIRNEFAHSTINLHFDSEKIAPLYATLKRPENTKYTDQQPNKVFVECVSVIENSLQGYLTRMGA
jgi:DNA-binding MltR family transcriptional regulator